MSWFSKSKQNVSITPEMAAQVVANNRKAVADGKHVQRPVSPSNVRRLMSAMLAGGFINNGDPIIFDENGYILEGQHRLEACALSGVTIQADVSVRPSTINGVKTIETYGSKPRGMGIKLLLADGTKYYNQMAAVANMLSYLATGKTVQLDIGQARAILEMFESDIGEVLDITNQGQREVRTWFRGPLIWACKIDRTKALEFAQRYVTMENVPKGDPTLALRVWLSRRDSLGGFSGRADYVNVVCSALRAHFDGVKVTKITSAPLALDWLLAKTKSTTRKVNEIVNPPELLKLAA